MVAVAQLAERRPVEANVAGSFPVSHPNRPRVRAVFYYDAVVRAGSARPYFPFAYQIEPGES